MIKVRTTFTQTGAGNMVLITSAAGLNWRNLLREAGPIYVRHIRELLGTDDLGLEISAEWSRRKKRHARYTTIPGKSGDQPLILTADLYHAIAWRISGNGLEIGIVPRDAGGRFAPYLEDGEVSRDLSGGEVQEYARHWNDTRGLHFIEHGIEKATPEVERMLQTRIEAALHAMIP